MRGPRTIAYILIAGLLILTGALVWTGCSGDPATPGGTGVLSGTQPFVVSSLVTKEGGGTETVVGDITQVRDATVEYSIEGTDPRATGTCAVIYNMDQAADGSGKMWGTWVVTTSEGTWVCDAWSGHHEASGDTFVYGQGKGTGKYDGLVSHWLWYWNTKYAPSYQAAKPAIAASGWIEKAQ